MFGSSETNQKTTTKLTKFESILSNPKKSGYLIRGKNKLTRAMRIANTLTISGKGVDKTCIILQAPLLIESGIEVRFTDLTIKVMNFDAFIGTKETFNGKLAFDHVDIVYDEHVNAMAMQTADLPGVVLDVASPQGSLSLTESSVDTLSARVKSASINGSTVGNVFGHLSTCDGLFRVKQSTLSNVAIYQKLIANELTTYGGLVAKQDAKVSLRYLTLEGGDEIDGIDLLQDGTYQITNPVMYSFYKLYCTIFEIQTPFNYGLVNEGGEIEVQAMKISDTALRSNGVYDLSLFDNESGQLIVMDSHLGEMDYLAILNGGQISVQNSVIKTMIQNNGGGVQQVQSEVHIDGEVQAVSNKTAMDELNEIIGMSSVKQQLQELIASATMNKRREEQGLKSSEGIGSLHMIFSGNAGTGKTTVARIIAKAMFENGILPENKFVSASAKDMVAGYVGQTAPKTHALTMSALGGVLFIDEAYTLASGKDDSGFGAQAIGQLIADMENNRDNLVVIMAGYTKEMTHLVQTNQGINSRFTHWVEFTDYSVKELYQIGLTMIAHQNGEFDRETRQLFAAAIQYLYKKNLIDGNARFIRNFVQAILTVRDARLFKQNVGGSHLNQIIKSDIKHAVSKMEHRAKFG